MFSITDRRARALVSWNVRTMPRRAILWAATPLMSAPSNVQSPCRALSKPVSRLKNVVLPAPFGPISAVIAVALDLDVLDVDRDEATERDGSRRPPRGSDRAWRRQVSVARRQGLGSSADIEHLLALVTEDALRPEDHQQGQRQAGHDVLDDAEVLSSRRASPGW